MLETLSNKLSKSLNTAGRIKVVDAKRIDDNGVITIKRVDVILIFEEEALPHADLAEPDGVGIVADRCMHADEAAVAEEKIHLFFRMCDRCHEESR